MEGTLLGLIKPQKNVHTHQNNPHTSAALAPSAGARGTEYRYLETTSSSQNHDQQPTLASFIDLNGIPCVIPDHSISTTSCTTSRPSNPTTTTSNANLQRSSHRKIAGWMRWTLILLIPVGLVFILFIVISPLLHYLM